MLAATVRSGVIEAEHPISAVVVDRSGATIRAWGDPDRVTFLRSAAKPFQATISQEHGAELPPEWMAVACASHGGQPVHLAIVAAMLESVDLTADQLLCPPAWPLSAGGRDRLVAAGHRRPRPLFHNCSGKHAAMLRACRSQGWAEGSYTHPEHPLQQRVFALTHELTGVDPTPVGVDGCGLPVLRGSLAGLARAFSALTVNVRFREATRAMSRFPALVADAGDHRLDGRIAAWWGGPMKVGAQGLIAAGRQGLGIAVKAHDGSASAAAVGMMGVLRAAGLLSTVALDALEEVAEPPVLGGGRRVGAMMLQTDGEEPRPEGPQ